MLREENDVNKLQEFEFLNPIFFLTVLQYKTEAYLKG
jgi:hypothetical protein